jgi:uncharacterized membrane protein (DUF485 family)
MARFSEAPTRTDAPVQERETPPATGGSRHHPEVDWLAIERSPEFKELTRRRRNFVVPALAFVFVWYFGFIALAGYAPDFMGERIYEGFTVGYAIALSQFVMTWVLGWLYLRQADRVFDPLSRRVAERARQPRAGSEREGDGSVGSRQRFDRTRDAEPRPAADREASQ